MMYIIFYKIYDILKWSINISNINEITSLISVIISILLIFIYLKTVLDILLKKERLFYELLSNTKNISTIKYEKNKQNKNESISENGILET